MNKKTVTIFHNPTAGDGRHEKEQLTKLIRNAGYICRYRSVKSKRWKNIPPDTDFIAIAGGDGTVKKCIRLLCTAPYNRRTWRIGLLPLGTANNIATTLDIKGKNKKLVENWGKKTTVFNTGMVKWGNKEEVFGEAVGVGMFPVHLDEMKKAADTPYIHGDRLLIGSIDLLRSAGTLKPFTCEIELDGKKYDGEYLLVEVMNIRSIGPNIVLSPDGNTGDDLFDVVMIRETERAALTKYIYEKLVVASAKYTGDSIKAKKVKVKINHDLLHIDDELIKHQNPVELTVEINSSHLSFFI